MQDTRIQGLSMLAALLAAACGQSPASESVPEFRTAVAEVRRVVSSVVATGTIEPIRVIDVKSQASGEILEITAELGDFVERGTVLVRINPRDVRNDFEQAEADLEVARARFQVAERRLARTQALHDSSIVTAEELETEILEHANARAALVRAEASLELATDRLNDVVVRAPISGTVVERQIEEGQIVTSTREVTGGTLLLRMADLSEVQVRTMVDETDIGSIDAGLTADITVEAYPDRTFRGSVLKVEPQAVIEQSVTMFAVLTRIVNEQNLLRPGMNADVEIVIGRRDEALTLKNAAIKTVEEATQLVEALGLDPSLLQQRVEVATDEPASGRDEAGEGGEAAGEGETSVLEQLRTMSQEERRAYFQNLESGERQRIFALLREAREQEELANRTNPARPRPAFVFTEDDAGTLTLQPVTIGLSSWEYTEILAGLEEGDQVLEVPMALVQQRELLERIRSRSGVPGVQRSN
ncbi:MAG: efflux RND transporter periplasmic adaptor subunit [Gemmatimonadota bacterium]|nr:MAG: efflux RND transporter periplasmic adaptor subunit [Gemmatimonadota bacterium]